MQIRMRTTLTGTRDGQPWPARGETVDLPDDEAAHMVAAGLAESFEKAGRKVGPGVADGLDGKAEPVVEEATAPEAERSTPTGRKPATRRK